MAETLKILGQVALSASTSTDVYSVPTGRSAVVSKVAICNRNASARTVRLSFAVGGEALANKQYVLYDYSVAGNTSYEWPATGNGVGLGAGDIVRAYASDTDVSVSVFGVEVV